MQIKKIGIGRYSATHSGMTWIVERIKRENVHLNSCKWRVYNVDRTIKIGPLSTKTACMTAIGKVSA